MRRLINSMVIFTFVMIAGLAMSTVEVRAEEVSGYTDEYGVLHMTGGNGPSYEEGKALDDAYAEQYIAEHYGSSTSDSSSSSATQTTPKTNNSGSTSQKASSAPKYTEAEIEAAWSETGRTEATCSKDGVITYKNSLTGKTKTEAIPATGKHTYELTEHVDSTCINNGYDTYTCTICGDSYQDEIATTGHTEGEPQITKYAGSFSTGESKTYCTTCGELVATTTIPQTFPLPLSIVGAFGAGAVVFLLGLLSLIGNKKK